MGDTRMTNAAAEAVAEKTEGHMVKYIAEAEAMVKAQTIVAIEFPRNKDEVLQEMMETTQMIAEHDWKKAMYQFPRGQSQVTGIAAPLARDLAVCYRNCDFGFEIVSIEKEFVHIIATFIDFQKNVRIRFPAKFKKLIQRKKEFKDANGRKYWETVWIEPDERDLRELINRHGAIATRNAILSGIPEYIIRRVESRALQVLLEVAGTDLAEDRPGTVKKLVAGYEKLHVSKEMMEVKLGHPIINITPAELDELRQMYASIRDGNSNPLEYFTENKPTSPENGNGVKNPNRRDGGASLNDVAQNHKQGNEKAPAQKPAPKPAAKKEPKAWIDSLTEENLPKTPGQFVKRFINARKLDVGKVCDSGGFGPRDLIHVTEGKVIPDEDYAQLFIDALRLGVKDSDYFKAICNQARLAQSDKREPGENGKLFGQ